MKDAKCFLGKIEVTQVSAIEFCWVVNHDKGLRNS